MSLLHLSGMCALLIAVILLLRLLLCRRLPAACFNALWLTAAVRLLLPISLPSRLSVYNLFTEQAVPVSHLPLTARAPVSTPDETISRVLVLVWGLGAALLLVRLLTGWLALTRIGRNAQPVDNADIARALTVCPLRRRVRVRSHALTSVPFTYGVLRPVIVLPSALAQAAPETLHLVLLHELCHIRRWDCLRKLLFALVRCLHWFNPLVWLLCHTADADLERGCDQAVLRLSGVPPRTYAGVLLQMAAAPAPDLCSAFRRPSALEERIYTIMTLKHRSLVSLALSAAVFAATTSAFAANAQPEQTEAAVCKAAVISEHAPTGDIFTETTFTQTTTDDPTGSMLALFDADGNPLALDDLPFDEDGTCKVFDADGNEIWFSVAIKSEPAQSDPA